MKKRSIINWNDVKDSAPLPHYIKDGSIVTIEINDDGMVYISGTCLFSKEDPTLSSRSKVNHFHTVRLFRDVLFAALDEVDFALNTAWNVARAVAPEMGWKNMESVETATRTRVRHPIKINQEYPFHVYLEPMKGNFKNATLEILDVDNKTLLIILETKVNVSTE